MKVGLCWYPSWRDTIGAHSIAVPVHANRAAGLHDSGSAAPAWHPTLAIRLIGGSPSALATRASFATTLFGRWLLSDAWQSTSSCDADGEPHVAVQHRRDREVVSQAAQDAQPLRPA